MTFVFDKGMLNIEKCFRKFKENIFYIWKDFIKQINKYYEVHQKMCSNYEFARKTIDEKLANIKKSEEPFDFFNFEEFTRASVSVSKEP